MNREAFLQALIDNVASRLESTVASEARHGSDKDKLRNLLLDIDIVDPSKDGARRQMKMTLLFCDNWLMSESESEHH